MDIVFIDFLACPPSILVSFFFFSFGFIVKKTNKKGQKKRRKFVRVYFFICQNIFLNGNMRWSWFDESYFLRNSTILYILLTHWPWCLIVVSLFHTPIKMSIYSRLHINHNDFSIQEKNMCIEKLKKWIHKSKIQDEFRKRLVLNATYST